MEEKIDTKVAIYQGVSSYNDEKVKSALCGVFRALNLDEQNPLSKYIKKGSTVLIKPNWVRDHNPLGHNLDSLITHTGLIKSVLYFVALGLEGEGRVVIGDAPLQNCRFDKLIEKNKLNDVIRVFNTECPKIEVLIEDWRLTTLGDIKQKQIQITKKVDGDNRSMYELVDLGRESFLEEISDKSDLFRVTKYKPSLLKLHHKRGKHEYLVTQRIFDADFVINLPKLKTHIKAGLTGALKNLVGINGHKEFLPHHIKGSSEEGGDNYRNKNYLRAKYEDLYDYVWENLNSFSLWQRRLYLRILRTLEVASFIFGKEAITAGSWSGNDTIWRTTLDLNHILYFRGKPKKVLNIVDGIISGEGKGPLEPEPKETGIIIAGENPALVDALVAKLIGYDVDHIKTVKNALEHPNSKFKTPDWKNIEASVVNNSQVKKVPISEIPSLNFKKPPYWENI